MVDLIDRSDLISPEAAAVEMGVSRVTYERLMAAGRAPHPIRRDDGEPIGILRAEVRSARASYRKWQRTTPAHASSAAE